MTRYILTPIALISLGLLAACAAQPAAVVTASPTTVSGPTVAPTASVPTSPLSGLAQITHNDLQSAIQIANANTPPDAVAAQCYAFLDNQLTSFQGTASGIIPPQGVVSIFETGRLGVQKVQGGLLTPAQRTAVDMACGPLALSIQGDLAGLLNTLGLSAVNGAILVPKL